MQSVGEHVEGVIEKWNWVRMVMGIHALPCPAQLEYNQSIIVYVRSVKTALCEDEETRCI